MIDLKENLELIDLFKGLRVTDVRDGKDLMGCHFSSLAAANA